jgi:hypothetical protein
MEPNGGIGHCCSGTELLAGLGPVVQQTCQGPHRKPSAAAEHSRAAQIVRSLPSLKWCLVLRAACGGTTASAQPAASWPEIDFCAKNLQVGCRTLEAGGNLHLENMANFENRRVRFPVH